MPSQNNSTPIEVLFPVVQNELLGAILAIRQKYGLSYTFMDSILNSCHLDIKSCLVSELSGFAYKQITEKENVGDGFVLAKKEDE